MKRISRIKSVMIVTLIAISLLSVSSPDGVWAQETQGKVKIGVIVPMTGPMSYLGKGEQVGLTLGLNGLGDKAKGIELLFDDSQGKPEVALTALRKMMDTQGVRIFVASTTPSVMALMPAIQSGAPNSLFVAQCLAPGVTKPYPFAYRIYTGSDQEIEMLVEYAKKAGYKKLAMLYIRNSFGEQGAKLFAEKAKASGAEIVISESIDFQEKDFRILLGKTRAASPDAVFVYCYASNYPALLQQMEEVDLRKPILGSLNLALDGMENKVAPEILGRAVFPAARYYYDQENPKVKAFAAEVKAAGAEPTSDVAYFYDTAQLLGKAIAMVPSGDPAAIGEKMRQLAPYEGVTGSISFDDNRDARVDMKLVRWENKRIVVMDEK